MSAFTEVSQALVEQGFERGGHVGILYCRGTPPANVCVSVPFPLPSDTDGYELDIIG